MHPIIAALYAFVFSFCHANSAHHTETTQSIVTDEVVATTSYVPTRQELARAEFAGSYAGTACISCRKTNVSYSTR